MDDEIDDTSTDANYSSNSQARSHHRTYHTGTTVFISHDIIQQPKLVPIATRLNMTPCQQAAYTKAIIEETGGDISKISTSYATADRSRHEIVQKIANTYKEEWVAPKFLSLHWNSKLMSTLANKDVLEECMTTVVGNSADLKLLGVPGYQSGTDRKSGDIISGLTMELLEKWNCADSVVNMTFDMTASNTGHISAACITIQQHLNRALLWSACRHHVGEIILTHVFDDLKIEASRSPNVTLFTKFLKNFDKLPHTTASL